MTSCRALREHRSVNSRYVAGNRRCKSPFSARSRSSWVDHLHHLHVVPPRLDRRSRDTATHALIASCSPGRLVTGNSVLAERMLGSDLEVFIRW